jgi:hypothetical protein
MAAQALESFSNPVMLLRFRGGGLSVLFAGTMPEGATVRFCSPNIVETIQQTVTEALRVRTTEVLHARTIAHCYAWWIALYCLLNPGQHLRGAEEVKDGSKP